MTSPDQDGPVLPRQAAAYRRAAARPSVTAQVERLTADLAAHDGLAAAGDPRTRGAALAAAHAALVLAVSPATAEADRRLRRAALDAAVPRLAGAGLAHVGDLVRAALVHDHDPAVLARAGSMPQ